MSQLKAYRENKSLTQEKAAPLIGTTLRTLTRWENGVSRIPADALPRIQKAYGLTDKQVLALLNQAGKEAS